MKNTKVQNDINGWINLDKPKGMTSTQAVGALKRILKPRKIGHAGTLDPLADGVLPIALGEATKTVGYMMDAIKSYRFTVVWGEARSTDDAEGEVIETSMKRPKNAEIEAIIGHFCGVITQIPPIYSALKVNGQRAYDLARAGEVPEMKPRQVRVDNLTVIPAKAGISGSRAGDSGFRRNDGGEEETTFEVTCGKGTYVRALARDMARALGTVGYVSALKRTRVGGFHLTQAISLAILEEMGHKADSAGACAWAEAIWPLSTALDDIPALTVAEAEANRLRQGQSIPAPRDFAEDLAALYFKGEVVAIGERLGQMIRPKRVFNQSI